MKPLYLLPFLLLTGCSTVAPTDPATTDCFIFVTDFDGTKA